MSWSLFVSLVVLVVSSEHFAPKPSDRWTPLVNPSLPAVGLCCFAVHFRASLLVSCKAMSQGTLAVRTGVESEEEEVPPWRGSGSPVLWDPLMGRVQET